MDPIRTLSDSFATLGLMPAKGRYRQSRHGEAIGGAAPAGSRKPYDRSTSYSRYSDQRRSPYPTAASCQSAPVRLTSATDSKRCAAELRFSPYLTYNFDGRLRKNLAGS